MVKIRLLLLFLTILVVGVVGTIAFQYARGYRLNQETLEFSPNGLFVIKSDPDAAQVFVDGTLKAATNANFPLLPGTYDISVRKDGYISWTKRLTFKAEDVTEATAHLFRIAPSLSTTTFSGVEAPLLSPDLAKLSYVVPINQNNQDAEGLWIMETLNLPLGFAREPRRITDGNLLGSSWVFSPDTREILLTTTTGVFLLDTSSFTPQSQRVNVSAQRLEILNEWEKELAKRLAAQMRKLPDEMQDILSRKASNIVFSPDKDMVSYTASGSATIPNKLIPELPGSSTQPEDRGLKSGFTYVYDIEEDRNFLIDKKEIVLLGSLHYVDEGKPINWNTLVEETKRTMSWYPTSRHLIVAEEGKITIADYDGTNRQVVYSGAYVVPHAYPTLSLDRLLILTNLGANSSPPNLYSLGIK